MKTKFKSSLRVARQSFGGAVCAGAILFVASDAQAQNMFVTDAESGNIYEFAPDGTQSVFVSGSPTPYIEGLAINSTGDLFVGVGNGDIYKYTPDGTKSIFASGLNNPAGLAFNSAGDLFEADWTGNIYEFTPSGVRSTFASGLYLPEGLAFNSAGDLFAADWSGNIYKFTPSGVRSTFAINSNPQGLAFNSTGNLFVADGGGYIFEYAPDGTFQGTFASGLNNPNGLAFDSAGDLFVANSTGNGDLGTGSIYKFTPDGTRSTIASGFNPEYLAFQGITLPVPEPSALGILAAGAGALLVRRRCCTKST